MDPHPPPAAQRALRVALCQLDLCVGDLDGNVAAMAAAYRRAERAGADLVAFPELAVCGYPPEDLLLKPGFVELSQAAVAELAAELDGRAAAVVGWVDGHRDPGADPHDPLDGPWNAAAVLHGGRVVASYHKQALPNYGVFDEKRYFDPGPGGQPLLEIAGVPVAVTICEDLWVDDGPVAAAAAAGAALVVNINASPFHRGKQHRREQVLVRRADRHDLPIAYVNLVGGQDDLVFDGGSCVSVPGRGIVARSPRFEPDELVVDVAVGATPAGTTPAGTWAADDGGRLVAVSGPDDRERAPLRAPVLAHSPDGLEEVWSALVLGVADYVGKNGFGDVVVGLSGGVDSALVATIAVDALGAGRVHGVLMPSRYSSAHSVDDARSLCAALGIECRTIGIEAPHAAFEEVLAPSFEGRAPDLTEENLQSRIRGVMLMALSNKFGWLVLTTGNKSETAVGYSTLYGDTAGGLAVIKDVPKLLVYELCRWRNDRGDGERVPSAILTKAPSAELRPDQRDDQSLPPYEVLDPLIEAYVDGDLTVDELVSVGHDPAVVERIAQLVDRAEYKRRQSPPGIRISEKSFGRDRRLPITNGS